MKIRHFRLVVAMVMSLALAGMLQLQICAAGTLVWPVPGHRALSQGFHDGSAIDISDGSIAGAAVVAAMSGRVTLVTKCTVQHLGSLGDCDGLGTGVVILGDDGRYYQYGHMAPNSIPADVYTGVRVAAGQRIGSVGTTGNSSGYHMHFGITSSGKWWEGSGINPLNEKYTDNANTLPQGCVDTYGGGSGSFSVSGWAFDRDNVNSPVSIHVYIDDTFIGGLTANVSRPDVNRAYPGVGDYHGFFGSFTTSLTGSHRITVWAIDIGGDGTTNVRLGSEFVTISPRSTECSHSWGSGTVTQAASCTADGVRTYTCSLCKKTKTEKIIAAGHKFSDIVVSFPPTCAKEGRRIHICTVCGENVSEVIPKEKHQYVTTVVAPTTATKGYTLYKCSVCGDSYASDYKDPLPDTGNTGSHSSETQIPTQPETSTTPPESTQPTEGTTPQIPPQTETGTKPQPAEGTTMQTPAQVETGTKLQPAVKAEPAAVQESVSVPASPAAKQQPVGTVLKEIANANFKVTGEGTVAYVGSAGKKSNVYIPAQIIADGVAYQVTSIAADAFAGNNKLRKVTIGANIRKIGADAFRGCKNLKNIYIETAKLKKKSIGKRAFSGINRKAVFRISNSSKVSAYKKILRTKGASATAKYI